MAIVDAKGVQKSIMAIVDTKIDPEERYGYRWYQGRPEERYGYRWCQDRSRRALWLSLIPRASRRALWLSLIPRSIQKSIMAIVDTKGVQKSIMAIVDTKGVMVPGGLGLGLGNRNGRRALVQKTQPDWPSLIGGQMVKRKDVGP